MEETTIDGSDQYVHGEVVQTGHTLSDQAVQILVIRALDAQVSSADVVNCFIIYHEAAVRVLEGGVGGQDGVVWFHHRRGDLWGRVDAELELALLAIINRETLHEESTESRSGSATERVEHQETLQTGAVVRDTANLVENLIDEFLAHGVVASSVVIRGILFSCDHMLGMEELAVRTGADLVNHVGFEVAVDGSGDIFALT